MVETDLASGNTNSVFSFYCVSGYIDCPSRAVYAVGSLIENSSLPDTLGAPVSITFYDKLQREVRTQTYTLGGR